MSSRQIESDAPRGGEKCRQRRGMGSLKCSTPGLNEVCASGVEHQHPRLIEMNVTRWTAAVGVAITIEMVAGCHADPVSPPAEPPVPTFVTAIRQDPPENVLSTRIAFSMATAPDSVRVTFQETGAISQSTPFRVGKAGADTITVLGLKAGSSYSYQVDAFTGGVGQSSLSSTFTTAELPSDLAEVKLVRISGGTSRYTATGVQTVSGGYAVVFDSTGAIAWYHNLTSSGLNVADVMMQPNGDFTASVGNGGGFQDVPGYFIEITPDGQEVRTWHAPNGYHTDLHEIRLTGNGPALKANYITYDIRTLDLGEIGGRSAVATAGHQIVRQNLAGTIEFSWDAWTHIGIDEWVGDGPEKETTTSTDFDHPNSISFDAVGNYVISWRDLNQIMAINSQTGDILWRIGGVRGEYEFVNDREGGFSKQHAAKTLSNGNLLVYDNGTDHDPRETRAVEYRLDHAAKTATLVWEYRHDPPIYTGYLGWVERLANGNTWVAFALAGRVVEVDPSGKVVCETQLSVDGANGAVYRLLPIASLYSFVQP